MKKIYILLSSTGTLPAKTIRFLTHREYSHTSIAIVPSTKKFYSYARRKINNPLIGGFIEENTKSGIFGLYPNSKCILLEIEVSDSIYNDIAKKFEFYFDNYDKCKYSFKALIPMTLGIKQKLKFKMTCSQFVATLLDTSGACTLPKHASLMKPCDFLEISNAKRVFIGELKDLCFPEQTV